MFLRGAAGTLGRTDLKFQACARGYEANRESGLRRLPLDIGDGQSIEDEKATALGDHRGRNGDDGQRQRFVERQIARNAANRELFRASIDRQEKQIRPQATVFVALTWERDRVPGMDGSFAPRRPRGSTRTSAMFWTSRTSHSRRRTSTADCRRSRRWSDRTAARGQTWPASRRSTSSFRP